MNSYSGVCVPGKAKWKSVRIFWGNTSLWDFNRLNPFPEVRVPEDKNDDTIVEFKRDVNISPFEPTKTYSSGLKNMDQLFDELDYDFDKAIKQASHPTKEILSIDQKEIKDPLCYIDNVTKERYQEVRKDGKKLPKTRKGLIANAVSQHVIVKIDLTTPVFSTDELPNFTTWAFLQPPTIGKNKYRLAVNNGYVIDDAQKAGWFKATFDRINAKEDGIGRWSAELEVERSKVDDNAKSKKDFSTYIERVPARILVDPKEPNSVHIKFEVVVRNDSTLQDLEDRKAQLKDSGLVKDVVTAESGSYLKVWVRNSEHGWSEDPVDDLTENVMNAMMGEDESYDTNNPQKFKNHTWRRSPILSGKNNSDLLYVGLYPAPVINRLEKLDEALKNQPKKGEESVNYGVWLGLSSLFSLFCYVLNKANEESGREAHVKGIDRAKDQETYIQETGKKARNILRLFNVAEFAAALATVGFPSSQKSFSDILSACEKEPYKSTYTFTVYIFQQMLDFALVKDDKSEKDHYESIDKENKKLKDKQAQYDPNDGLLSLKNIASQKSVDKKKLKEILGDFLQKGKVGDKGKAAFNATVELGSLASAMKMPFPKGAPLPIPFLQWIIWSTEFLVKSGLSLTLGAEYEAKEKTESKDAVEKVSLDLTLNSDSKAQILFSLQSAWTAYLENTDKKYEVKDTQSELHNFYVGQMLQDLAKSAEFNLFVGLSLDANAKIGPKFEYDFEKEDDAFSVSLGNAGGNIGLKAPAGVHIGMFQWDYRLASADLVSMSKNEAKFFEKLTFLDNRWTFDYLVRWAAGRLADILVNYNNKKEYFIGDTIKVALGFDDIKDLNEIKLKGNVSYISNGDEKNLKGFEGGDYLNKENYRIELRGDTFIQSIVFEYKVSVNSKKTIDTSSCVGGDAGSAYIDFVERLSDGKEVDLLSSITIDEDERSFRKGEDPVLMPPIISMARSSYLHSEKSLVYILNIDQFNDREIWVRFKERDTLFDDVLSFAEDKKNFKEWNLLKLKQEGDRLVVKAPLDCFDKSSLDFEFDEKELLIYPELAIAPDEKYMISKDVKIEPARVTPSMASV